MIFDLKKAVFSIALTFFLGPGVGHIYLGKFKKGVTLFAATLAAAVIFFYQAIVEAVKAAPQGRTPASVLSDFYAGNPKTVLYFDIIFAAIWAYAFIDAYNNSRSPAPEKPPEEEDSRD